MYKTEWKKNLFVCCTGQAKVTEKMSYLAMPHQAENTEEPTRKPTKQHQPTSQYEVAA